MKYPFLEHMATADVVFEAVGKTLEELFLACALATTESMVDISLVEEKVEKRIQLENFDVEKLLFEWLEELVFLKDSDQIVFKNFDISIEKGFKLNAILKGEANDINKHEPRNDVKAVTMHQFKVEETEEGWKARIILDI